MSVVLKIALAHDAFKLGQILPDYNEVKYSLETIVPLGEAPVPFIRVDDGQADSIVDEVTAHPAVRNMTLHTVTDGDKIYSLDWDSDQDTFFQTVSECQGHVLSAESVQGDWRFKLEFPDRDAVSEFAEMLRDQEIQETVLSVSKPGVSDPQSFVQLTDPQREALKVAHSAGYYDIPRKTTTEEVAKLLGISDQAVSERLRRGIARMIEANFTIDTE